MTSQHHTPALALLAALMALVSGCASNLESAVQHDLDVAMHAPGPAHPEHAPELDGRLESYLAFAAHRSPALRADFERWRASVHRISQARRLPSPVLSYGLYLQHVETAVGPQRHRFGLRQAFPWPTRLSRAAAARSHQARAAERRFDSRLLALRAAVAEDYYDLWAVHAVHAIENEQEALLDAMVVAIRARLVTGAAALADLAQAELVRTRHRDHHEQHRLLLKVKRAHLRARIGAGPQASVPMSGEPPQLMLPALSESELLRAVGAHPEGQGFESLAMAHEEQAEAEHARRLPGFVLGFDYIETGTRADNPVDNGKDPMIASLAVELPIWVGSYSDAEASARASARATRADAEAARLRRESAAAEVMARLQDAVRRVALYDHTLVPQARTAFDSVQAGYQAGSATVAQLILAQRELLQLQLELVRQRQQHAVAWARLEQLAGRSLAASEVAP